MLPSASLKPYYHSHSLLIKNESIIAVGKKLQAIEEYDVDNDSWFIREEQEDLDDIPEGGFIIMKYNLHDD